MRTEELPIPLNRWKKSAAFFMLMAAGISGAFGATLFGPTPYLSSADSPFVIDGVANLFIEDFEDGILSIPGVSAISNTPGTALAIGGGGFNTDSVDGDDRVIDGFGRDGQAMNEASNLPTDHLGYTFQFNAALLGGLPTHAGIVWTDGSFSAPTQVEFFGPGGVSLGLLGPEHISDNSFAGETGEDRFFGAFNAEGIESFTIRSPGGGNNMTVDHLQFTIIPEPTLFGYGLVLAVFALKRRFRHQN